MLHSAQRQQIIFNVNIFYFLLLILYNDLILYKFKLEFVSTIIYMRFYYYNYMEQNNFGKVK